MSVSCDPKDLIVGASSFCCIPKGMRDDVIIYLLCQIANGGASPGTCTFQEGAGSPVGSATPAFIGQLYHDTTADAYYRSTGLTAADWTAISGSTPGELTFLSTSYSSFVMTSGNGDTKYSFPNLTTIATVLDVDDSADLKTLDFPVLVTINGDFDPDTCPNLTTINVPNWVPSNGTNILCGGCALNAASVEQILRRCVLAGVTTCTIDLSGGTNAGTASLSAQGQADVATLGAQVTMNP